MNQFQITMSKVEFLDHCEEYNGLCLHCGAIRYGNTEPDAEDYYCEECSKNEVIGFENALMLGYIELDL